MERGVRCGAPAVALAAVDGPAAAAIGVARDDDLWPAAIAPALSKDGPVS